MVSKYDKHHCNSRSICIIAVNMTIMVAVPVLAMLIELVQCDKGDMISNSNTTAAYENPVIFDDYLNKICDEVGTCSQNFTNIPKIYQSLKYRSCMCDDKCTEYGDCCSDSAHSPLQLEGEDDDAGKGDDGWRPFQCVPGLNDDVYMVTTCPSATRAPSNVVDKCHLNYSSRISEMDVLVLTPVTTDQGVTYRNMFCAFCHDQTRFHYWRVLLAFEMPPNLTDDVAATAISDSGNANNTTALRVVTNSTTNVTGPLTNSLFSDGATTHSTNDISGFAVYFRTNNTTVTFNNTFRSATNKSIPESRNVTPLPPHNGSKGLSKSNVTFNVNATVPSTFTITQVHVENDISKEDVDDPSTFSIYRQLMLTLQPKWRNSSNGYGFAFQYFVGKDKSGKSVTTTIELDVFAEPKRRYPSRVDDVRYCIPNVVANCASGFTNNHKYIVRNTTTNNSTVAKNMNPDEELCTKGPVSYVWNSTAVYKNEHCAKCNIPAATRLPNSHSQNEATTSRCWWRNSWPRRQDAPSKPTPPSQEPSWEAYRYRTLSVSIYNRNFRDAAASHCDDIPKDSVPYLAFCTEICFPINKETGRPCLVAGYYPLSELEFSPDNATVYSKSHDTFYSAESMEFTILEDGVFVCGSYVRLTRAQRIVQTVDDWLTATLLFLSCVCLLLHLALYPKLAPLDNATTLGKNLAAYCVTLLVSYAIMLAESHFRSRRLPAIVMHYSLLSCFCWMLVIAYDYWRCLSETKSRFATNGTVRWALLDKRRRTFRVYCVIGWTAPLLFVLPAVYMEVSESLGCDYRVGYGLPGETAFIRSSYWLLRLFIIPSNFIFAAVLVFFGMCVWILTTSREGAVSAHHRTNFRLYIRVAILMGVTWTSSLVVIFVPALAILYNLLNSSQGIAIFCAFTCKKKLISSMIKGDVSMARRSSSIHSSYLSETETATMRVAVRRASKSHINMDTSGNQY